jgi:hypothetical protein
MGRPIPDKALSSYQARAPAIEGEKAKKKIFLRENPRLRWLAVAIRFAYAYDFAALLETTVLTTDATGNGKSHAEPQSL